MRSILVIFLAAGLSPQSLASQQPAASAELQQQGAPTELDRLRKEGSDAYNAKNWQAASTAYRRVVELAPKDQTAWFRLSYIFRTLAQLPEAENACRIAADLGGDIGPTARFNLACIHALKGNVLAAFVALDRSLDEAPVKLRATLIAAARTDEDLAGLRSDARFEVLLTKERSAVDQPKSPPVPEGPLGWALWEKGWEKPDPEIVKDAKLRAAIEATGLPWRVRDCLFGIEMLLAPPGTYVQGADDPRTASSSELPRHKVRITRPFYVARYEVSYDEWHRIMGTPELNASSDALKSALTQTLTTAVAKKVLEPAYTTGVPKNLLDSLVAAISDTVTEQLATPSPSSPAPLSSPASSDWLKKATSTIADAVTKRLGLGSSKDVIDAVGDGVTQYVRERGVAQAVPMYWAASSDTFQSNDKTGDAWAAIQVFLEKSKPLGFRLPTEAQWEYACRAGGGPTTSSIDPSRSGIGFRQVTKPPEPNGLGVYNMLGSVAEWCSDYYVDDAYRSFPPDVADPEIVLEKNPHPNCDHLRINLPLLSGRVLRGGCATCASTASFRDLDCTVHRRHTCYLGFRPIRPMEALTKDPAPYVIPEAPAFDAPALPLAWASIVEDHPDPKVVTDPALRAAIEATGLPWRVRDRLLGIELLLVPPGKYFVGHSYKGTYIPNSDPRIIYHTDRPLGFHLGRSFVNKARDVEITVPFYLGRYEILAAEQAALSNPTARPVPRQADMNYRACAFDSASVDDFLRVTGTRLPTEVEWEVACRAGTREDTYGLLEEIASMHASGDKSSHYVGQKRPNAFGFYDTLGSGAELCVLLHYENDYPPTGALGERGWVLRGGDCRSEPLGLTAWSRDDRPRCFISLRVARDP